MFTYLLQDPHTTELTYAATFQELMAIVPVDLEATKDDFMPCPQRGDHTGCDPRDCLAAARRKAAASGTNKTCRSPFISGR